ncbi:hypothetical protein [Lentzea sp. NEAU-D7]|uniref:hypothetical protein n=1 Tax=Lentzea sp. NEAU-D7 TaxID=2994667 RepID=UPI00224B3BF1|nr:hypothetical protein [Lentzea sp. NEAU-D7]MCX2948953.1 hypothetical protein [Lentzea sp. NEAU-D7]
MNLVEALAEIEAASTINRATRLGLTGYRLPGLLNEFKRGFSRYAFTTMMSMVVWVPGPWSSR